MKPNLKELRKAKGWSQETVADKLGMAHNSVSQYETGKTPLSPEMIQKFAKVLEVSPGDIKIGDELREAVGDWKARAVLEALSDIELIRLLKQMTNEWETADAERRIKLQKAMGGVTSELENRPNATAKDAAGILMQKIAGKRKDGDK